MNLRRLRWLTIIGPLLFLGTIEIFRYSLPFDVLRSWPFSLALLATFALAIVLFSRMVLDHVEAVQKRLLTQNAALVEMEKESRSQAAMLRGLHEAGLALVEDLSLDPVLQHVIDLAKDLGGAEYGALAVFDEEGSVMQFITSGISAEEREVIGGPPEGHGLLGELRRMGRPMRVKHIRDHPASVGFPPGHPPMNNFLGVPIHYKERLLGNIYLTNKREAVEFTELDSTILELFAAEAAIAIENARLVGQVRHLAIEQERQRIGREMHDGLGQILGYVNMKAGAVRRFLIQGNSIQAAQELQELERAVQEVSIEVREAILGLRTMTQGGGSLVDLIQEYLVRYTDLTDIPVEFEISCSPEEFRIPPEEEVQLIRVIQEALSNVRKHARATKAVVRIGMDGETARLEVADDGRGFEVDHPPAGDGPQFGLHTMRERVESLGGHLSIHSVAGHGTQVVVKLPRHERSIRR